MMLRLYLCNKQDTMRLLTQYFDRCIDITGHRFINHSPDLFVPDNIIVKQFDCNCEQSWVKSLESQTGNHLMTVSLALQAYNFEKGIYPADLNELVKKGYLTSLPLDPFAESGSFHYINKGKKYLLYSIGPDGKDNNGSYIKDQADIKLPSRNVWLDCQGDIVAGENTI